MKSKKFSVLLAIIVLFVSVLACGSTAPAGISNIYMANDLEGTNKLTTFASTDVIYVFFDVNEVATGAKFQVNWYALNVDGQDPATPFVTTDYDYTGESVVYAQIESTTGGFPAANYKVEISLDGVKVGEQLFSVQ